MSHMYVSRHLMTTMMAGSDRGGFVVAFREAGVVIPLHYFVVVQM